MKKGKIGLILVSLFAITNAASCNISFDQGSSSSLKSVFDSSFDDNSNITSGGGDIDSSDASSSSNDTSEPEDKTLVSISLDSASLTLMLGSTSTLTVRYNPANTDQTGVDWSSSNAAVASVDNNGLVTAKATGEATITATSKVKSSIKATCKVTVTDNVILASVDSKHEFVLFEQNKSVDPTNDNGFYDREQKYKVGDDNDFNVKPALTVLDAKTYTPVSASSWSHDFVITASLNGTDVGAEYFSVTDARECDIDFTDAAVGKTFVISVVPGGVDSARAATLKRTLTVEVVDGYNVYDPKELGYFDNRELNSTDDTPTLEGDVKWQNKWPEFKAANGLRVDYQPAALILQKDIKVTTADLPSNFFYTEAKANELGDPKAAGSLIDFTFLYARTTHTSVTIDGNYFSLDLSAIPLVVRERCKTTEVGAVVSHAAAFKANRGEDIKFQNINMSGNARNAVTDDDKIFGGGFIFVKGAGSKTFTAYNIIATKFFITFMGEKPHYEDSYVTAFNLNKVKCYNNYNSFLYNWGSMISSRDSLYRSCGGPIVIQDHTTTDTYETNNGLLIEGYAPTTNFTNCTLENYVAGTEAWFIQFGATAQVQNIKGVSDLLGATGLPKSYVVNQAHEGKFYQALAAQGQASFFNFIAFNKSGSAEGLTTMPACGTVNITNNDKTLTYNYRQPAYDSVCQAYLAYSANPGEATQQALIAAAMAKGITFAPDYSDVEAKIGAYVTAVCTEHMTMRALNNAGAPVIDLGSAYDLLGYDGANSYLQNVATIAAMQQGGSPAPYQASADQLAATPDYMALYFSGMMLVLELKPYVA